MPTLAEPINRAAFNTPGELFNDNMFPQKRTYLQRIDNPNDVKQAKPADKSNGRIRRQLGVNPADMSIDTVVAVQTPVQNRQLAGSFSLVRAAQVAHQHRIGLWDAETLPSYLGYTTAPEVTAEDLQTKYNDMLLFTYVPAELLISQDEFNDMASPPLRAAYLASSQFNAGISTAAKAAVTLIPPSPTAATPDTTIPPAPFAEITNTQCSSAQSYFNRPQSALTYTAEQYRVNANPPRPTTTAINGALV